MQSQQKKVKWSRGETADALEERTDTGITNVSVARMVNCMPDIYGNISRRPAFKLLDGPDYIVKSAWGSGANAFAPYADKVKSFTFYITKTDYIVLVISQKPDYGYFQGYNNTIVGYRVVNNKFVRSKLLEINTGFGYDAITRSDKLSFVQQNNYALLGNSECVWKLQLTDYGEEDFTMSIERWYFEAGWYAPNGTSSKSANGAGTAIFVMPKNLGGVKDALQQYAATLTFSFNSDKKGFGNWTQSYANSKTSTVYSWTSAGCVITSTKNKRGFVGTFNLGDIIHMPNIGCYFRLEGYVLFKPTGSTDNDTPQQVSYFEYDITNTPVDAGGTVPTSGLSVGYVQLNDEFELRLYKDGMLTGKSQIFNSRAKIYVVQTSADESSDTATVWYADSTGWHTDSGVTTLGVFGSLLTPAANTQGVDSIVNIETGYISLTPPQDEQLARYPHPSVLAFCQQRLWASGWLLQDDNYNIVDLPGLVIGSQIAKYTDLKNDYNLSNEAITVDILTRYQEQVLHLIDYNGLKIFTDAGEYSYSSGAGVQRQSANGSLEVCEPIIMESLCLYADQTGRQIRAMQYEFQNSIYDSSVINNYAPKDLVFNPYVLTSYEDKLHNTGMHLFVLNKSSLFEGDAPTFAVCNFVPANQANIWSRWQFPNVYTVTWVEDGKEIPGVVSQCVAGDKTLFVMPVVIQDADRTTPFRQTILMLAELDFDSVLDLQTTEKTSFYKIKHIPYAPPTETQGIPQDITIPKITVSVYDGETYKWDDTLDQYGNFTKPITGLTNPIVGLKIDASIESHPVDVGGKTKTVVKRIGKAVMSVRDTNPHAVSINGRTGYMNPAKDSISFYNVANAKREIRYTITNINGAKFTIESLTMNIEYGTLIS